MHWKPFFANDNELDCETIYQMTADNFSEQEKVGQDSFHTKYCNKDWGKNILGSENINVKILDVGKMKVVCLALIGDCYPSCHWSRHACQSNSDT